MLTEIVPRKHRRKRPPQKNRSDRGDLKTFAETNSHASYSVPAKGPVHTSGLPHKDDRQECFDRVDQEEKAADVIARSDLDRRIREAELEEYNEGTLSDELRKSLSEEIRGHVQKLSFDPDGCRMVQSILHLTTESEQQKMALELRGHVKKAVESAHCNHVLQRCIELLRPSAVDFVLCEIGIEDNQVRNLAKHRYGCRVLQRIIEHFSLERLTDLLDKIIFHAQELCFDEYGNYVIKHLIEHGNDEHKEKIVTVILKDVSAVTKSKEACSVLDKALCYTKLYKKLIEAILEHDGLLVDIACSHIGYEATRSLCRVFSRSDDVSGQGKGTANKPLMEKAQSQLTEMLQRLQESKHGKKVFPSLLTVFPALGSGSQTGYTNDGVDVELPAGFGLMCGGVDGVGQMLNAARHAQQAEGDPRQGCFRKSRKRRENCYHTGQHQR